jgi:hypothetical protein
MAPTPFHPAGRAKRKALDSFVKLTDEVSV